ncbi:general substrate transporter, partial [Chytriomyces sp. MP71]
MDNLTWGTFDSLFVIGGAIGSMFGGYLAERYGRRNVLLLTNIPFVAASVLLASSTTVLALFAGRLLAGLAAGICTVTLPMYIAEVAPAQLRGSLGALTQVSLVSGILCVQRCA